MNDESTTTIADDQITASEPIPAAPAKPKAKKVSKPKKAAPPKVKKPAVPKKPAPAAPKTERKKRTPKAGLRLFQVRTLKALDDSNDPMTVSGIAKRAKISHTMVVMGLGTIDPKLLKAHDKKMGFPSLLTLGLVKVVEIESITALAITAAGRKAIASAIAALTNGKLPKKKVAAA